MSIRNAIIGSFLGVGFSGLGCSAILTLLKRYNRDKENNEGETMTLSRQAVPILFEQFSSVIVTTCGLIGLYYGYKETNSIKLLKN
tara:strand:- start:3 stop:260 length:258 start_codon:yes stop_codon:yes gene_type:complete